MQNGKTSRAVLIRALFYLLNCGLSNTAAKNTVNKIGQPMLEIKVRPTCGYKTRVFEGSLSPSSYDSVNLFKHRRCPKCGYLMKNQNLRERCRVLKDMGFEVK